MSRLALALNVKREEQIMRFRMNSAWLMALVFALLLTLLALPVAAQTICDDHAGRLADINTREQLKQYVHCAAAHIEAVGWEQAALDFEGGDWYDEPVYLFAGADGAAFFIVGSDIPAATDMSGLQDSDGVWITQEMERIVTDFGGGYVYYRFMNRVSGQEEPKLAYVKLMERDGAPALVGSGYYPQNTHATCSPDTVRASLVYSQRDVERFVDCAAHHLQQNGLQALHDFEHDPRWHAGPTYLFLIDLETALIVAHPGQPQLVGTDGTNITDPDGVKIVQEMQRILASHDDGFMYYSFRNPATNEEGYKGSYVQKLLIDGRAYFLGSGLYVPSDECRALPLARDINTRDELQLFVRCGTQLVEERGELAFDLLRYHPQWVGGSTYLFVSGSDCRNIFYPLDYLYDESRTCAFEDSVGNLVNQDILDMSTSEAGAGWVDYVWLNPASDSLETKNSYIIGSTLDGEHVSIGAGLYESEMQ